MQATGHFRVEPIDDVWWLISPEGNAFFSAGVNATRPDGDFAPALGRAPYQDNVMARYGSEAAWADATVQRFADLQLTTIGAWSRYQLFTGRVPYTSILDFAARAPAAPGVSPGITGLPMRDYFAPAFVDGAAAEAQRGIDCEHDQFCIGVFSDNELGWGPGVAQSITFLDGYLRLPAGAPGKMALQGFLEDWSAGDINGFNTVWNQQLRSFDDLQMLSALPQSGSSSPGRSAARQAFAGRVAQRYYQVVHDALRAAAPEVLILGSRLLAYSTSEAVAQAMSQLVDVVSINQYELTAAALSLVRQQGRQHGYIITGDLFGDLDAIHAVALRPMLISEFGYRAADSGLPNSYPPQFPTLSTQVERAAAYERYMHQVLARPYLVGAHWFEYADQPASGRFDGENNNWGIVNIEDDEYPELAARMRLVNADRYQRRPAQ